MNIKSYCKDCQQLRLLLCFTADAMVLLLAFYGLSIW